jgi:hypothetical protein
MEDKIMRLIMSNQNEKFKNTRLSEENRKIKVALNWLWHDNKKNIYIEFNSDLWKKKYFLPLGYLRLNDEKMTYLSDFKLEDMLGINLEKIFKHHKVNFSLYNLFNKTYVESDEKEYKDRMAKFMDMCLGLSYNDTHRLIDWLLDGKYEHYYGKSLLLNTYLSNIKTID